MYKCRGVLGLSGHGGSFGKLLRRLFWGLEGQGEHPVPTSEGRWRERASSRLSAGPRAVPVFRVRSHLGAWSQAWASLQHAQNIFHSKSGECSGIF